MLFSSLYRSWCHNPVAVFALCLLAQAYEHASNLLQIFAELELTVSLLVQIDKLVMLIESPVFTSESRVGEWCGGWAGRCAAVLTRRSASAAARARQVPVPAEMPVWAADDPAAELGVCVAPRAAVGGAFVGVCADADCDQDVSGRAK
jgi:hypothetical protein